MRIGFPGYVRRQAYRKRSENRPLPLGARRPFAMTTATPAYDKLAAASRRLYHFGHLASITRWDQETNMPPGGNEARGAAPNWRR